MPYYCLILHNSKCVQLKYVKILNNESNTSVHKCDNMSKCFKKYVLKKVLKKRRNMYN